jgi:hypothetical protein
MALMKQPLVWSLTGALALACFMGDAQATIKGDVEGVFQNMERNLCRSFQSSKCRHAKPQRRKANTQRRRHAAKAVEASAPSPQPEVAAEPKWKALPPIPKRKPAPPEDIAEAPRETVIAMTPPPLPPEKPKLKPPIERAIPQPQPKPAARVVVNVPETELPPPKPVVAADNDGACYSKLKAMNADFLPQATGSGACRVNQAVMLRAVSVGGREVKLPDRPIVNCAFALQFSTWVKATGVPLAKLYTGPGFQCRGRNGDSSAKLSEHGTGNAVDIERMQLSNGDTYLVKDAQNASSKAYATLKGMRASACAHFTTVLGPGANAAHAEHFHLDLEKRGRKGNNRLCE